MLSVAFVCMGADPNPDVEPGLGGAGVSDCPSGSECKDTESKLRETPARGPSGDTECIPGGTPECAKAAPNTLVKSEPVVEPVDSKCTPGGTTESNTDTSKCEETIGKPPHEKGAPKPNNPECHGGTPDPSGKCTNPAERSERGGDGLECPGNTSRTADGNCTSESQPAAHPVPQQENEHQQEQQPDLNRVSTDNGSEPAGSGDLENTSTTEGQATTSSGDSGSNNTNLQTQPESANEGGDSNPSNQTAAAAGTTGTEGSHENGNADSTSTTITTTTTTLPPELTNNKKGDADSSSS
ncbi:uncharacterized protein TM35_000731000, partial [Trypanosoma theileri]